MLECLLVFAQGVVVGGQGAVQAEPVIVCGGGCVAEFGFEDDDLQAGVCLLSADCVQDGLGGFLLIGGLRC